VNEYEFVNVESMEDRVVLRMEHEPRSFDRVELDGKTYVYPAKMPQCGPSQKGAGRGAQRDSVTSYTLPLKGTAMAKNMPPIEKFGGAYDADGVAHFETKGQYGQYAPATETEDGGFVQT